MKQLALIFGCFALLAMWTDRSLEFICFYAKGYEVEIPYWISFIITIFLNGIIIIFNIIVEILRHVL